MIRDGPSLRFSGSDVRLETRPSPDLHVCGVSAVAAASRSDSSFIHREQREALTPGRCRTLHSSVDHDNCGNHHNKHPDPVNKHNSMDHSEGLIGVFTLSPLLTASSPSLTLLFPSCLSSSFCLPFTPPSSLCLGLQSLIRCWSYKHYQLALCSA